MTQPVREQEPVVRIYQPTRSVMQAGKANVDRWVLQFEPRSAPFVEPLMGWTASRDTLQQVRLTFPTKQRAVDFAEGQGWAYFVSEPHRHPIRPKSYVDNFRTSERRVQGGSRQSTVSAAGKPSASAARGAGIREATAQRRMTVEAGQEGQAGAASGNASEAGSLTQAA